MFQLSSDCRKFLAFETMSEFTFNLEQILESVNEMQAEVREFIEPNSTARFEVTKQTWQAPEAKWFEDCDFDPR